MSVPLYNHQNILKMQAERHDSRSQEFYTYLQFCPQRLQRQVVLWQQELGLVLQLIVGGMQRRRLTYSLA